MGIAFFEDQRGGSGFRNEFEYFLQLYPTVESMNGTEVIWQIPSSPSAVLFLAHGCHCRATHFWDKSVNCPTCVGLPEDRRIVLHALTRSFAVLTISSAGRCWSFGYERIVVRDIISHWIVEKALDHLPLVALGASSGGHFVSLLATDMHFRSIALMVAEGMFHHKSISTDYPPTIFIHMPRDEIRARKIRQNIHFLRSKKIEAGEIVCREFPLSPSFLHSRVRDLDLNTASELFVLFQRKGFIDMNGYMKRDGRATPWKKNMLKHRESLNLGMHVLDHIQEEMNLAYAYHEITSLSSHEIFNWFESHF